MNYLEQIKSLLNEAREGIQYKGMSTGQKVFTIISMIPIYAVTCVLIGMYYVSLFFYNALLSPTVYLESWLEEKKSGVKHATEAVIYAVCIPYIFFSRVIMSLMSYSFYMIWFFLMCATYLATLGGVKWQPSINVATFEKHTYILKPSESGAMLYTVLAFGFQALAILLVLIYNSERSWELYRSSNTVTWIYFIIITILNPILFRKKEVKEEESTAEAKEPQETTANENA